MSTEIFIGLMSGTSMDAIDAALVGFDDSSDCTVRKVCSTGYPEDLATRLREIASNPDRVDLAEIGELNLRVARAFANAANTVMAAGGVGPAEIKAIGSHGQTILHRPDGDDPFSLQLGDPAALAALTGCPVVADFRSADIALGGQGAPLAPAFHRWAFGDTGEVRAVVNIGGIANVTRLDPNGMTTGFDTGPGNALLDQWNREHRGTAFDAEGAWAAGGTVDDDLLTNMLADPYFQRSAPKSTGTDYFSPHWLREALQGSDVSRNPQDVQATLSELTARTIANSLMDARATAVCGGGAFNTDLMARLRRLLHPCSVDTTAAWGIDPEWVEAIAFAWLARQRLRGEPSNVPDVTGAREGISLGGLFLPP